MEPFAEMGANFSLQLSSRKQFAKISNKKLSPKINVKNIKLECKYPLTREPFFGMGPSLPDDGTGANSILSVLKIKA